MGMGGAGEFLISRILLCEHDMSLLFVGEMVINCNQFLSCIGGVKDVQGMCSFVACRMICRWVLKESMLPSLLLYFKLAYMFPSG